MTNDNGTTVALFGHSGFGHSLVILVWSLVIPTLTSYSLFKQLRASHAPQDAHSASTLTGGAAPLNVKLGRFQFFWPPGARRPGDFESIILRLRGFCRGCLTAGEPLP